MTTGRVQNGIHVSNHPDRHVEEMMLVTRPTGAAVVLHQLMLPNDAMLGEVGGDADNYNWMPLRYGRDRSTHGGFDAPAAPERLLVVRLWQANDPFQFDPVKRAEYLVGRLQRWTAHGYPVHDLLDDPYVAIQATNEANIEPASSLSLPPTQRYDRIARWESSFWDAFDRAAPGRRCLSCGPNLAAGHDWLAGEPDSEYDHPGIADLCHRHIDTGGLVGVHVYFHGHRPWERGGPGEANQFWHWLRPFRPEGWRDAHEPGLPHDRGGVLARFPDARFAVTEAGTWQHADVAATERTLAAFQDFLDLASASGRFVAFCPFIWDTSRAVHPQNIIADNERLRAGLVELADAPAAGLPRARPGYAGRPPDKDVAIELEPDSTALSFAWPVGSGAANRAGPQLPSGWVASLGYGEEYELGGVRAVHPGIDLNLASGGDSDLGAPVVAAAPGVVVASSYWSVWGNVVLVRHRMPDGASRWTQYAHLLERLVESGDQLGQGDPIGTIGKGADDRYSAHLHFEIRRTALTPDHWPGDDAADVRANYVDPVLVIGRSPSGEPDVSAALRRWADLAQVIQPNEAAALQTALRADGYYPISGEGDVEGHRAQLARDLDSSAERIYYARIGDWANVRWIARR